jgi:hypothetical protein
VSLCSSECVETAVCVLLLFRIVQTTQLVISATSVSLGTQEMPHRELGQTVNHLDLFPSAGVTAEAAFDLIVRMVTSAFARFVPLSYIQVQWWCMLREPTAMASLILCIVNLTTLVSYIAICLII